MSEAAEAEFDTLADWTATVAADLGADYHVPAGCRGSGSPAALDWLVSRSDLSAGDTLLDCGAGVGGPAAYAARSAAVSPLLVEPEAGACRAARRLFGYPVVRAAGSDLPIRDQGVDAAWSLGVLCTMADQHAPLAELRRVVRCGGRIGLLVFVAHGDIPQQLEDNNFPDEKQLRELVRAASLHIVDRACTADLPSAPDSWTSRVDEVDAVLEERYGHCAAWQLADRQSSAIGNLINDGVLSGELLVLHEE